jgi:FkbM family methyltransferase
MNMQYGYEPSFTRKFVRALAKYCITLLRLEKNGLFATELCQQLNPTYVNEFNGHKIIFMTGHGRLLWRAETLKTEEPLMIQWLESFSHDDIFMDVGANVGTYSIAAAFLAKRVIAIELDPSNLYCLYKNININRVCDKVIIIPTAANDSKGIEQIHYRDVSLGDALQSVGRSQVLKTILPNPHIISQLALPIDTLVEEFSVPQPTMIKIDVDGNEIKVLNGAWRTISRAREIYIEDNFQDEEREFLSKLLSLGYRTKCEHPIYDQASKKIVSRNLLLSK